MSPGIDNNNAVRAFCFIAPQKKRSGFVKGPLFYPYSDLHIFFFYPGLQSREFTDGIETEIIVRKHW